MDLEGNSKNEDASVTDGCQDFAEDATSAMSKPLEGRVESEDNFGDNLEESITGARDQENNGTSPETIEKIQKYLYDKNANNSSPVFSAHGLNVSSQINTEETVIRSRDIFQDDPRWEPELTEILSTDRVRFDESVESSQDIASPAPIAKSPIQKTNECSQETERNIDESVDTIQDIISPEPIVKSPIQKTNESVQQTELNIADRQPTDKDDIFSDGDYEKDLEACATTAKEKRIPEARVLAKVFKSIANTKRFKYAELRQPKPPSEASKESDTSVQSEQAEEEQISDPIHIHTFRERIFCTEEECRYCHYEIYGQSWGVVCLECGYFCHRQCQQFLQAEHAFYFSDILYRKPNLVCEGCKAPLETISVQDNMYCRTCKIKCHFACKPKVKKPCRKRRTLQDRQQVRACFCVTDCTDQWCHCTRKGLKCTIHCGCLHNYCKNITHPLQDVREFHFQQEIGSLSEFVVYLPS